MLNQTKRESINYNLKAKFLSVRNKQRGKDIDDQS
jgi:hypothetical protein